MTGDLVKRNDGTLVKWDSVDGQMEMFKKLGLSPLMVETHKFERLPDGKFKLAKRTKPIAIFDDGDGRVLALSAATQADKVGLNRLRGKYNDENRLFDQDSASIKVGEVEAWRTI